MPLAWVLFTGAGFKSLSLSGKAMGTGWRLTAVIPRPSPSGGPPDLDARAARTRSVIERRLEQISQSMSIHRPDSEISLFNAWTGPGPFPVSEDMARVMEGAISLHRLTRGAWDGSLKPLADLWGFGSSGTRKTPPGDEEIRRLRSDVGFHLIEIIPLPGRDAPGTDKRRFKSRALKKKRPGVQIDLSSIAKGYALDMAAGDLRANGVTDFILEAGGEIVASGLRKDGGMWRVGVQSPIRGAPAGSARKIVALKDMAMATSGDYRLFFKHGGAYYSHILDPGTGRPARSAAAAASVIAPNAMMADGLATALLVMGRKKGVRLINRLRGVECMVIERKNGRLTDYYSKGFDTFVIRGRK